VGFHDDALDALHATKDDTGLATSVITAITADGRVRPLLLSSGLAVSELTRLLTIAAARLGALVAGGTTSAEFSAFASTGARVALLNACTLAAVPTANIRGLVPHLKTLDAQVTGEAGHLVTLLANTTAAEIVAARDAAPKPDNVKLALLVAIRPKALVAADLTAVLTFCTKAGWDHAQVTGALVPLANGRTLAQLLAAVHQAELDRFNQMAEFAAWLYAVDRLVQANYVRVQARDAWHRLTGNMTTDERWYDVVLVATGAVADNFCVHFHPDAIPPDINNKNASRSHLKPQAHGTTRYYTPDMLKSIRPHIQLRPPQ
jgi:hypothetical protein